MNEKKQNEGDKAKTISIVVNAQGHISSTVEPTSQSGTWLNVMSEFPQWMRKGRQCYQATQPC